MTSTLSAPTFKLSTPVVFIVFNRPHETQTVWKAIVEARPSKLYIISDGARPSRIGEETLVNEVRAMVSHVDWPCEVKRNFAETNMGCRERIASGLTWVFDNENEAIILEDDCLPEPTFFRFCQELLEKYRNDPGVSLISGSNLTGHSTNDGKSYWYSNYAQIWGWATWKRVWDEYDVAATSWPQYSRSLEFKQKAKSLGSRLYWKNAFDSVYKNRLDTWDYQLALLAWRKDMRSVVPRSNLISNIGFGAAATHTVYQNSPFSNKPVHAMDFPLSHPTTNSIDNQMDSLICEQQFNMSVAKFILSTAFVYMPPQLKKSLLQIRSRALNWLGKFGVR